MSKSVSEMHLLVKEQQFEQSRDKQNFKVKYCKLILYQLAFVLFLTLYFSAILWLYLQSLDTFHPRIRHRKSQPGLALRPITDNPYTTLIEFTSGYNGDWNPLKQSVRDFFKAYKHGMYPGTSVKCRWEAGIVTSDWCHVSRRKFELYWKNDVEVQCNKMENYGYTLGKPCIYLKPTKLFDWEPEPYHNVTEVEYLESMPQWLKHKISKRKTYKNSFWKLFIANNSRINMGEKMSRQRCRKGKQMSGFTNGLVIM